MSSILAFWKTVKPLAEKKAKDFYWVVPKTIFGTAQYGFALPQNCAQLGGQ